MAKKVMPDGYKDKITDEELINLIESGVNNSTGKWLNSSELTRERQKATWEYAGVPTGHLAPQGVSTIVDTSTTETVEAYLAVISDLMFSNGKLARFVPYGDNVTDMMNANKASAITNYCIFKKNDGWNILNTWVKASLLWKNAIIRWDYVEDFEYIFEEYDEISEEKLDQVLAEDSAEIVGDLIQKSSTTQGVFYEDVRIRKKMDYSRVKLENIHMENFRITRNATSIEDATFIGVQTLMTRSEIRKQWPEVADKVEDWDDLAGTNWGTDYTEEKATRKEVVGLEYWSDQREDETLPLEANREVAVTECWLKVDRDGDGIAELKHFMIAGTTILFEEDTDMIPLASICPFEMPYEFYGLSIADMTRSSTLASTAILRGFVENTYLSNYSPKLADPNVVDFSALQNLKPKQIIPTNGNPATAVAPLPPETISTGTVPLLEYLQMHKEQATGMSKAAQGLNDTLYVSGNSEQKVAQVQTASQKRIQHIARRFAETGFKRLCMGVYKTMQSQMKMMPYKDQSGLYATIDPSELPRIMDIEIDIDIGENSNANMRDKLTMLGSQILPMMKEAGVDAVIKPEAPAVVANKLIASLDLDPSDFIIDYTTDEFKEQAAKQAEEEKGKAEKAMELENRVNEAEAALKESNVKFTDVQADNTIQDNTKQLAVTIDKHRQEWAKLQIDAQKEGVEVPETPSIEEILDMAVQAIQSGKMHGEQNDGGLDAMAREMGLEPKQAAEMLKQFLQSQGGQGEQQ